MKTRGRRANRQAKRQKRGTQPALPKPELYGKFTKEVNLPLVRPRGPNQLQQVQERAQLHTDAV